MKKLLLLIFIMSFFGCAVSPMSTTDLKSLPLSEKFTVNHPVDVVYESGLEHISNVGKWFTGLSGFEPKYNSWFLSSDKQIAWFRQPFALVELRCISDSKTEVLLFHPKGGMASLQGNSLIAFFKGKFKEEN